MIRGNLTQNAKHFKVSLFHKVSNSLEDIGDKLQLKFKHVRDAFKPLNLQRHWLCGMTMVETPLHRVHLQGLQNIWTVKNLIHHGPCRHVA